MKTNMRSTEKSKLHTLETMWIDTINTEKKPPIYSLLSKTSLSPILPNTIKSLSPIKLDDQHKKISTYDSICIALGFKHHEGTNKSSELKVLKSIIIREDLLMNLKYLYDKLIIENQSKIKNNNIINKFVSQILELMTQIRESTASYIENLIEWRLSVDNYNILHPRIFYWNNINYTMKIITDLDYLSDNQDVVKLLGIPSNKIKLNPLMLSNTLNEIDQFIDPSLKAVKDAKGIDRGPIYEDKLRYRKAERILIQEYESIIQSNEYDKTNLTNITEEYISETSLFSTDSIESNHEIQLNNQWINEAKKQLDALDKLRNETLSSRSTKRLAKIEINKLADNLPGYPKFQNSSTLPWNQAPQLLTNISSKNLLSKSLNPIKDNKSKSFELNNRIHLINDNKLSTSLKYEKKLDASNHLDNNLVLGSLIDMNSNEDSDSHYQNINNNSEVSTLFTIDMINENDIKLIRSISEPFKELILAGAICIIVLDRSEEIPDDISWSAFLYFIQEHKKTICQSINNINPSTIPHYKISAIKPFLSKFKDFVLKGQPRDGIAPSVIAARKLITWSTNVIKSAIKSFKSNNQTFTNKNSFIYEVKLPNRMKKIIEKNNYINQMKSPYISSNLSSNSPNTNNTNIINNNKLSAIRKAYHIPIDDLHPIHTEIIENSIIHTNSICVTILLYRLIDGNISNQKLDRFMIKAYDVITSKEASIVIYTKEYANYYYNYLLTKYPIDVYKIYQPNDIHWWIEVYKDVITIKTKANHNLSINVSKKLLEQYIMNKLGYVDTDSNKSNISTNSLSKSSKIKERINEFRNIKSSNHSYDDENEENILVENKEITASNITSDQPNSLDIIDDKLRIEADDKITDAIVEVFDISYQLTENAIGIKSNKIDSLNDLLDNNSFEYGKTEDTKDLIDNHVIEYDMIDDSKDFIASHSIHTILNNAISNIIDTIITNHKSMQLIETIPNSSQINDRNCSVDLSNSIIDNDGIESILDISNDKSVVLDQSIDSKIVDKNTDSKKIDIVDNSSLYSLEDKYLDDFNELIASTRVTPSNVKSKDIISDSYEDDFNELTSTVNNDGSNNNVDLEYEDDFNSNDPAVEQPNEDKVLNITNEIIDSTVMDTYPNNEIDLKESSSQIETTAVITDNNEIELIDKVDQSDDLNKADNVIPDTSIIPIDNQMINLSNDLVYSFAKTVVEKIIAEVINNINLFFQNQSKDSLLDIQSDMTTNQSNDNLYRDNSLAYSDDMEDDIDSQIIDIDLVNYNVVHFTANNMIVDIVNKIVDQLTKSINPITSIDYDIDHEVTSLISNLSSTVINSVINELVDQSSNSKSVNVSNLSTKLVDSMLSDVIVHINSPKVNKLDNHSINEQIVSNDMTNNFDNQVENKTFNNTDMNIEDASAREELINNISTISNILSNVLINKIVIMLQIKTICHNIASKLVDECISNQLNYLRNQRKNKVPSSPRKKTVKFSPTIATFDDGSTTLTKENNVNIQNNLDSKKSNLDVISIGRNVEIQNNDEVSDGDVVTNERKIDVLNKSESLKSGVSVITKDSNVNVQNNVDSKKSDIDIKTNVSNVDIVDNKTSDFDVMTNESNFDEHYKLDSKKSDIDVITKDDVQNKLSSAAVIANESNDYLINKLVSSNYDVISNESDFDVQNNLDSKKSTFDVLSNESNINVLNKVDSLQSDFEVKTNESYIDAENIMDNQKSNYDVVTNVEVLNQISDDFTVNESNINMISKVDRLKSDVVIPDENNVDVKTKSDSEIVDVDDITNKSIINVLNNNDNEVLVNRSLSNKIVNNMIDSIISTIISNQSSN